MKSISLIKVTLAVFVTTLLSVAVSAEEKIVKQNIAMETSANKSVHFTQLDINKNGLLSETEVSTNKLLHDAFAQVDVDGDAAINKDEFSSFIKTVNK